MALLRRSVFALVLLAPVALGTTGAHADAGFVTIVGTPLSASFSPATITVAVGDSVTWANDSPNVHYVSFDGSTGGAVQNNVPYTRSFTAAGTFAYHCSKHPSMTGTVVVLAPPTAAPIAATAAPRANTLPVAPAPSPAASAEPTPSPTDAPAAAAGTADDEESSAAPLRFGAVDAQGGSEGVLPWLVALVLPIAGAASAAWVLFLGPLRLRRYWFEFDLESLPSVAPHARQWHSRHWLDARVGRGCGVTGRGERDCRALISDTLLAGGPLPSVRRVIPDIEPASVLPRDLAASASPGSRGVWYPVAPAVGQGS